MARKKLREYVVKVRETSIVEYLVKAKDEDEAMRLVGEGEGDPTAYCDRVDWEPESVRRND